MRASTWKTLVRSSRSRTWPRRVRAVEARGLHAPRPRPQRDDVHAHPLSNDLTARFDNKGGCVEDVAFAVPDGAQVKAGQQIAWYGVSGDAAGNHHLHFEGSSERRRERQSVQTSEASEQTALRGSIGRRVQPWPPWQLVAVGAGSATLGGAHRSPGHRGPPFDRRAGRIDAADPSATACRHGAHAQVEHDRRGGRRSSGRAHARPSRARDFRVGPRPNRSNTH